MLYFIRENQEDQSEKKKEGKEKDEGVDNH